MDFEVVKRDFPEKAKKLLEECLYLLNSIPNKKYKPKSYKDTYTLASEISKFLKNDKG